MSEIQDYDFAVLGGGSAGYAGARTAASLGLKTALMDGAEELGGLCILRGCMPSKTLIESGNRNLTLRHAAEYGLKAKTGEPDTRFIRDRKRGLVREFSSYRQGQLQDGRFKLLRGQGRIEKADDSSILLDVALHDGTNQKIRARTLLVATGSKIFVPPVPGLEDVGYWTSDTMLDAADIPPSFIVLGGGAIALEMAHYLEAIGRKVTVLQRSAHLLSDMDTDLSDVVHCAFEARGMNIVCGTKLQKAERAGELKRVFFEHQGVIQQVEGHEILAALGRKPATGGLELEKYGVSLKDNGAVRVSENQQTENPRIFAAGDVCSPLEVVHIGIQQGEIAARNAASLLRGGKPAEQMDYRCMLYGVFTHPQVAVVGLSEGQATRRGIPFHRSTYPFIDHGKSLVMSETDGHVKLLAHAETGAIIGGGVAGPEATELIHEIAVAMYLGATAQQLAAAPHYHPTLSEIWTYPAEELAELVKHRS
jgi:pyruvate/2-oxoglutarate dehydrogenase complex dihydrolipoamide dehydrogenase (E3) component